MNAPFSWGLLALAIGASAVAIWAGPNLTVAVPAAVVAITVAGVLFAEVAWKTLRPKEPGPRRDRRVAPSEVRAAFVSGGLGRERLITLLDRLERAGPAGTSVARRTEDLQEIVALPSAQFRRYVRDRLQRLEAET